MVVSSDFRFLQSKVFDTYSDIRHGFAIGAETDVRPIDLGDTSDGRNEINWNRLKRALAIQSGDHEWAVMNQVHGGECIEVNNGCGVGGRVGDVDGIVTTQRNIILAVRTADCCPILFAARGGVGVAHAGWRGVAKSIVPNTVNCLVESAKCKPEEIRVMIGPTIGLHSYEVGLEVIEGILDTGVPRTVFSLQIDGKFYVDIGAAVEFQLRQLGIKHIVNVNLDTRTDTRLHSYRRDGAYSGRIAGMIVRSD